jgi:hypothetical protein
MIAPYKDEIARSHKINDEKLMAAEADMRVNLVTKRGAAGSNAAHTILGGKCVGDVWEAILPGKSDVLEEELRLNSRCLSANAISKCTNIRTVERVSVYTHPDMPDAQVSIVWETANYEPDNNRAACAEGRLLRRQKQHPYELVVSKSSPLQKSLPEWKYMENGVKKALEAVLLTALRSQVNISNVEAGGNTAQDHVQDDDDDDDVAPQDGESDRESLKTDEATSRDVEPRVLQLAVQPENSSE